MSKPLHLVIRQYRVVQISLTVFLSYITYEIVDWMTATSYIELQNWHLAPVTAALPALVAGLFKLVDSIIKRNEIDECDKD